MTATPAERTRQNQRCGTYTSGETTGTESLDDHAGEEACVVREGG